MRECGGGGREMHERDVKEGMVEKGTDDKMMVEGR
jgi:hypothetical protein